jgi:hypothetical protein
MHYNVGGADRVGRLIVGVALIALNLFGILSGTLATIAWVVAAIAIVTGLIRFCPANSLFGINTCHSAD